MGAGSAGLVLHTGVMATSDRTRLFADLVGERHVIVDDDLTLRATRDWTGRWGPNPAIVVRPGSTDEVSAVVAACADGAIPVVPQGGNTGLTGSSVPPEPGWVVLSTERLGTLGALDVVEGRIVVGAGVTLSSLATHISATRWRYGVDFGARDRATIGGSIATNAGGMWVFRHGTTRHQIVGIEAVLGDGSVISHLGGLGKDNTGYDLAALLCGSEGTLGVVTAASLRLIDGPPDRCTALLGFSDISAAANVAWGLRGGLPELEVAELLGPGCTRLVAAHVQGPDSMAGSPVSLLVETAGDDGSELGERLRQALESLHFEGASAVATDHATRAALWRFRDGITDALAATGPVLKFDVSIPATDLAQFCHEVGDLIGSQDRGAAVWVFGHVCDHNVHVNVTGLDPRVNPDVEDAVLGRVAELGGSISAEHGIGRSRRRHLSLVRTAAEIAAMRAVKRALDPAGILNPGVIFD